MSRQDLKRLEYRRGTLKQGSKRKERKKERGKQNKCEALRMWQ